MHTKMQISRLHENKHRSREAYKVLLVRQHRLHAMHWCGFLLHVIGLRKFKVCMSVCLTLWTHMSHATPLTSPRLVHNSPQSPECPTHRRANQMFCTCYVCPWLGPPLTAVQYIIYFRFSWMRSCFHYNGANGPESKTTRMLCAVRQVASPGTKSAVSDGILLYD